MATPSPSSVASPEETAQSFRANLPNSLDMTNSLAGCCATPNDKQLVLMNNVLRQLLETNFSENSMPSIQQLFANLAVSPTMDSFSLGLMKFGCSFAVIVEEAVRQLVSLRAELAAAATAPAAAPPVAAPPTAPPPHLQQLQQQHHGNWNNNNGVVPPSSASSTGSSFSWAAHMEEETRAANAAAAARPTSSSQPWSPLGAPSASDVRGFGVLTDSSSNNASKQSSGGGGGAGWSTFASARDKDPRLGQTQQQQPGSGWTSAFSGGNSEVRPSVQPQLPQLGFGTRGGGCSTPSNGSSCSANGGGGASLSSAASSARSGGGFNGFSGGSGGGGSGGFNGFGAGGSSSLNSRPMVASVGAAASSNSEGREITSPSFNTRSKEADLPIKPTWSHPPSRRSRSQAPSERGGSAASSRSASVIRGSSAAAPSAPGADAAALAAPSASPPAVMVALPGGRGRTGYCGERAYQVLATAPAATPAATGQALLMQKGEGFGMQARRRDSSRPARPIQLPDLTIDRSPDLISGRINIYNISRKVSNVQLRTFIDGAVPEDRRNSTLYILRYPRDESGKPYGFAFAKFEVDRMADEAVTALNGTELAGKQVVVKRADFWFKDDAASVSYTRAHLRELKKGRSVEGGEGEGEEEREHRGRSEKRRERPMGGKAHTEGRREDEEALEKREEAEEMERKEEKGDEEKEEEREKEEEEKEKEEDEGVEQKKVDDKKEEECPVAPVSEAETREAASDADEEMSKEVEAAPLKSSDASEADEKTRETREEANEKPSESGGGADEETRAARKGRGGRKSRVIETDKKDEEKTKKERGKQKEKETAAPKKERADSDDDIDEEEKKEKASATEAHDDASGADARKTASLLDSDDEIVD